MSESARPADPVSLHVSEFRQRFDQFERERHEELRMMKHDFFAQFIADHVALGDKVTYDCMLQGMLREDERQRLETDPQFTRAWRIFVDMCWLNRLLLRTAMIVGAIALLMGLIIFALWALPHVAGPEGAKRLY